jgi:hypothetical protein
MAVVLRIDLMSFPYIVFISILSSILLPFGMGPARRGQFLGVRCFGFIITAALPVCLKFY